MSSRLAVSLYSAPLPSRLDSLTLTITRAIKVYQTVLK